MLLPTFILTILNIVLFIVLAFVTSIGDPMHRLFTFITITILLAPTMILHIYSVNCMLVGSCTAWSYIITLVSGIGIIMAISSVILLYFKSSEKKDEKQVIQESNQKILMNDLYNIPNITGTLKKIFN